MEDLEGKVVLVTGGSRGIGRATAERFAEVGARVVIAGRNEESGAEAVSAIRSSGGDASFVRADVADEEQVEFLVARCLELYARLDCAFNNAGEEPRSRTGRLHEYATDDWRAVLDVHLTGIYLCMKYEIRAMLDGGGGAIVNMSSVYGFGADTIAYPSYVASKHGAIGVTRSAALQYARRGIRINAVCPGVIRTSMLERTLRENAELEERLLRIHPMRRLGTPREVAQAVLWLCSDTSSFVTGHALAVDGGVGASV